MRGHLTPAPSESELQPRGFYVSRVVNASDATDAGQRAIQLLQSEAKYKKLVQSHGGQAPHLQIEEVGEPPSHDDQALNRSGYVFYEHEH
jgi:hypothetical protein